jgi:hypothetical protein
MPKKGYVFIPFFVFPPGDTSILPPNLNLRIFFMSSRF